MHVTPFCLLKQNQNVTKIFKKYIKKNSQIKKIYRFLRLFANNYIVIKAKLPHPVSVCVFQISVNFWLGNKAINYVWGFDYFRTIKQGENVIKAGKNTEFSMIMVIEFLRNTTPANSEGNMYLQNLPQCEKRMLKQDVTSSLLIFAL